MTLQVTIAGIEGIIATIEPEIVSGVASKETQQTYVHALDLLSHVLFFPELIQEDGGQERAESAIKRWLQAKDTYGDRGERDDS